MGMEERSESLPSTQNQKNMEKRKRTGGRRCDTRKPKHVPISSGSTEKNNILPLCQKEEVAEKSYR